ncbi:DUF1501 domain-containing protein [Rudaea cellulosilytica]|uniref:DUF1501 domain-containing protein n=1 Tax=Rudaea cellulosilytica TaxID=540746 RepID=UPI000367306C|nr:DUF1501 domain-containing protein [Rudaea cellulosilytica]
MNFDRRKFLGHTARAALGASIYSAFGSLQLVRAAAQANYSFSDYKALVCVFLYGGNDAFNMIVPTDATRYAQYKAVRPTIALAQNALLALNAPGSGAGSPGDGGNYGFHSAMPELQALFNQANSPVGVVANVGTLVRPVTKAQYQGGSVALPPQLFSHADQQAYWQSSPPSNAPSTGWGGRICDLLASANTSSLPMLNSLAGEDAFIRGNTGNNYIMNPDSAATIDAPDSWDDNANNLQAAFDALRASGTQANTLERTYAAQMNHSINTAAQINSAINATGMPAFESFFPNISGGDLDRQLCTVAKLIWAANNNIAGYTGQKRQVFFVSTGGFDTHDNELSVQSGLFALLSKSLAGFYKALNSAGLASTATAFTASDFGRTLSCNEDGTDHGWASHHLVVGGAVKGGKFYGDNLAGSGTAAMPSLALSAGNPNDAGYGQIIPTTSVDQYSATLASWFGLGASDLALLFPNLANFNVGNLGFV